MSVLETLETFKNGLMWVSLGALSLIGAACALAGLNRVCRVICRLNPVGIAAFAVVAIFATGEAQKRLLRDGGGTPPTVITLDEVAQGWRVESVVTNDTVSYAMPTNGVEYMPWTLRGGYETRFPLALLAFAGYAHTESETNAVAKSMLEFVLLSSNDNLDDVDDGVEQEAIVSWPSFLALGESEGWTPPEKKAAFAWYLSTLGTNDCTSFSATDQELVRIALSKCEELDYAEAAPSYKALALNPKGIYRYRAIGLALKYSPVSDATTEFVETIITNVTGYSSGERVGCYWEYAKKLRQDPCTNGAYASALSMFYTNRKISGTGAATLDRLFADKIDGYAQSSNRLDTALSMLTVTNMRPQFVEYFIGVTNQLLSSGQPLPWINVGGDGN